MEESPLSVGGRNDGQKKRILQNRSSAKPSFLTMESTHDLERIEYGHNQPKVVSALVAKQTNTLQGRTIRNC
jgi:hypothetical protein